jgi:hypothetical protein
VTAGLGRVGAPAIAWPGDEELARWPWLTAAAVLAAVPPYLDWAAAVGVGEDVVWATLADLPRQIGVYRQVHGRLGFDDGGWLTLHVRGELFALGRLQFQRATVPWSQPELDASGAAVETGTPALGVHIPQAGPLDAAACDASFARVRGFFRRLFPDVDYGVATCGSWLLDPQLAEYLPASSNIVAFQRRFTVMPGGFPSDAAVLGFVFHRRIADVDLADLDRLPTLLPQTTTLERAFVAHLRAGRHWEARAGWCPLP